MKTGRGISVSFCLVAVLLLSACTSKSKVACDPTRGDADCAAYSGTVCYDGYCAIPADVPAGTDLSFTPMDLSMSVPSNDLAVTPPDLSLFCGDGGLSSCPTGTPICGTDRECRACVAGDCGGLTPRCDAATGACAACTANADCTDGVNDTCSFDGSCRPACQKNAECTTGMCDFGVLASPFGGSVCARADEIVYVSASCSATRDGSQANPFCTLDAATAALPNGGFIHILSSATFLPPAATSLLKSYAIRGDSGAKLGNNMGSIGINIAGGSTAISGLTFQSLSTGVQCANASLVLSHVVVTLATTGVNVACPTQIDGAYIDRDTVGVIASGSSALRMTNTVISHSGDVGIKISGSVALNLNFDTLIWNGIGQFTSTTTSSAAGGILNNSLATGSRISNSIVWHNKLSTNGDAWTGAILGTNLASDGASAFYTDEPVFNADCRGSTASPCLAIDNGHLQPNAANNVSSCFNHGQQTGSMQAPRTDFDNQVRPIGTTFDIGADEVQ